MEEQEKSLKNRKSTMYGTDTAGFRGTQHIQ